MTARPADDGPPRGAAGQTDEPGPWTVGPAARPAGGPARYAVVGTGWRARFYLRLAAALPDHFTVTAVASRSAGPAATAALGVPTVRDPADLRADAPEFVVTSVPREVNPGLVTTLVDAGVPVLSETPPARDADGLRDLWARVGGSGLVQVAEQYLLMPAHAARSAVVRAGTIGVPTSVQVSSTHQYHAVSIIRGVLGVAREPATVAAHRFTAPLVDPLGPDGWRPDAGPRDAVTTIATMDFGGRMGVYDFTDNQWWNPLRAERIVVRGSHGEIVDDQVTRLAAPAEPVRSPLVRRRLGEGLDLEGLGLDQISLDGRVVYRNPYPGVRLSDEDIAIATLLSRTTAWVRGTGDPPYPLADACHDHLIALAVEEAADTGRTVVTPAAPW